MSSDQNRYDTASYDTIGESTTGDSTTGDGTANYDITVIGGGINGVAVAAEAASRGLRTLLVHSRDLASGASAAPVALSAENLQALSALDFFQLSSHLDELKHLQQVAPHLIDLLPVQTLSGARANNDNSRLIQRIFKHLRNRSLATHQDDAYSSYNFAARLKPARLVVSLALHAQKYGADIRTYHRVESASRLEKVWRLKIASCQADARVTEIQSRWIINCSGWLANNVLENILKVQTRAKAKEEFRTQFFFNNTLKHEPAVRKIFKLYGERLTFHVYHATDNILCFGPLKCDQEGYAECIDIQQEFITTWNNTPDLQQFAAPLTAADILYRRKGNIALIQDPCGQSDAPLTTPLLDIDNPGNQAVLMNIFGADPALAQKTARQAMDALKVFTGKKSHPTFSNDPLPGGDIAANSLAGFLSDLSEEFYQLPPKLLHRLGRNFGNLAYAILGGCKHEQDLGMHFGNLLYEREVEYLVRMEWAQCAEDILERRTFIHLNAEDTLKQKLDNWFAQR